MATGPSPFGLHWETSASTIEPGESLTLTIRMYEVLHGGEHGGISVSFPLLTEGEDSDYRYLSAVADVEAVAYTSGLSNLTFYGPGETIYHKDDNRMFPARYLLVESDDPSWSPSDDRTLTIRITPRDAGEFPIWVRGWICAEGYTGCGRNPVSGEVTDQQGYGAHIVMIVVTDTPL